LAADEVDELKRELVELQQRNKELVQQTEDLQEQLRQATSAQHGIYVTNLYCRSLLQYR